MPLDEIITDAIKQTANSMVYMAIQMIELELSIPEVLDSKIACDALKRAIANVRSLKS